MAHDHAGNREHHGVVQGRGRLIGRVIHVSMETVRLVNELSHAVSLHSVLAADAAPATVDD